MKENIKYLVMDVDGTLTDGKIYMGDSGEIFKAFNIKDGYGIHDILPKFGIKPIIITGRVSKITENRCAELGVTELHQGIHNKEIVLQMIMDKYVATYDQVAYIGDDCNDLRVMQLISKDGGIVGCPADAANEVKLCASYVSPFNGGQGAVRDFIEWIICRK